MSTIAVLSLASDEDPFRVGVEDHVALAVRRGERVLDDRSRRPWPRPTRARPRVRDQPRRWLVRHRRDVSAVRAEREAGQRVLGPRQRRADDLERRHVDDVDRTSSRQRRPDDITANRPSGLTALEMLPRPPGMEASTLRVVASYVLRLGDPPTAAREQGLAVRREPEVDEGFGLAPDDGDGVGAALDGGEQVGPRLARVLEMPAFNREQERLVVAVDDECLRTEPSGLGQGLARVRPLRFALGVLGRRPLARLACTWASSAAALARLACTWASRAALSARSRWRTARSPATRTATRSTAAAASSPRSRRLLRASRRARARAASSSASSAARLASR